MRGDPTSIRATALPVRPNRGYLYRARTEQEPPILAVCPTAEFPDRTTTRLVRDPTSAPRSAPTFAHEGDHADFISSVASNLEHSISIVSSIIMVTVAPCTAIEAVC